MFKANIRLLNPIRSHPTGNLVDVRVNGQNSSDKTPIRQTNFYMLTRWAQTNPLGKIAHLLQAFRPNGLIGYFRYSMAGRGSLREIIKIVATRCHIVKLKCIRFDFGWRSTPEPTGGAYNALLQTP